MGTFKIYGDLPRAAFFEDTARTAKKVTVDSGWQRWAEGPGKQNKAPKINSKNKQNKLQKRATKKGGKYTPPFVFVFSFVCTNTPPQGHPFASFRRIVKTEKERTTEVTEERRLSEDLPRQDLFSLLAPFPAQRAKSKAPHVRLTGRTCLLCSASRFLPADDPCLPFSSTFTTYLLWSIENRLFDSSTGLHPSLVLFLRHPLWLCFLAPSYHHTKTKTKKPRTETAYR